MPLIVRYAKNACCRRYLVVAVRSGEGPLTETYNGHSGPTAGTGLHAPKPTPTITLANGEVGW